MTDDQPIYINPRVHTACKNCVFAEYDGATQIGCEVGRLEKYIEISPEDVLECYDDEKEFCVINNKFCLYYRSDRWGAKQTVPKDEWSSLIRNQMKIMYHAIILGKENSTLEDFHTSIDSLAKQSIKPRLVTAILRNIKDVRGSAVRDIFTNYREEIIEWRIENTVNLGLEPLDYVDIAIDGTKQKVYSFYSVMDAGYKLSEGFSDELDRAINDDLLSFHMLLGPVKVVPKKIHLNYNGNSYGIPLEVKIETDICDNKLLQINQICQSIPA